MPHQLPTGDGHSRVSNRDPSYYRGPQDPNHPWYHVGFRIARKFTGSAGIQEYPDGSGILYRNYPNPFKNDTYFTFEIRGQNAPQEFRIKVFTVAGRMIRNISVPPSNLQVGFNKIYWNGNQRSQHGGEIGSYCFNGFEIRRSQSNHPGAKAGQQPGHSSP